MGEQKKLGKWGVLSLVLLNVAGTGLYFGPALSAKHAGTAALAVWLYIGLQSVYIASMFGELVALHPKAGGVYEFAKQAYGRFFSFLIGWVMWLVSTVMIAVLIVSALLYAFPHLGFAQMLAASFSILFVLSVVAYRGLGEGEKILDALAGVLILFVVLTVAFGVPNVDPSNYKNFSATPTMLFVALFFILETYFGWEAITFMAEETEQPRTTIPWMLLLGASISATLGMVFSVVVFGIIPADQLAQSATPLVDVFSVLFGSTGTFLLKAGVFLSLVGSAQAVVISGPRLLQAMARDKLFIHQLAKRSESTGTPARAIVFQAVVASAVLLFALGSYELLLAVLVPLALVMYVSMFLAVPVLRVRQPGERAFRAPAGFFGPFLVSLVFAGSLVAWLSTQPNAPSVLQFTLSLVLFGAPMYLLLNLYYNPQAQLWFADRFARLQFWLEDVLLPKSIRERILSVFGDLRGKTVLELAPGVGSFTMHLAEAVKPDGAVLAVESGKRNVALLLERLEGAGHDHVQVVHDEYTTTRLHPVVTSVDAVFSVGLLGYLQDRERFFADVARVLPRHGKVCFVEWVDHYGLIPNPAAVSDLKRLREEFDAAGFQVRTERVKGWLWNYLLVYGIRTDEDTPFV